MRRPYSHTKLLKNILSNSSEKAICSLPHHLTNRNNLDLVLLTIKSLINMNFCVNTFTLKASHSTFRAIQLLPEGKHGAAH